MVENLFPKDVREKISNIEYFSKGSRGKIYTGTFNNKKVAIKIKNPESTAENRINNEINFLKILNKHNIGPKLVMYFPNIMIYEFQEGKYFIHWWKTATPVQKKRILKNLLIQCYIMDEMGISKEEMLRPFKNVIIKKYNVPILIDFEKCHYTKKPKNVTQLVQFMIKDKFINQKEVITELKIYRQKINNKTFNKIFYKIFK